MSAATASAGRAPVFNDGDRVLVVAVHPDDETLATAGLIRSAGAAGAQVRVVFVTDGDNNPWPQRWIERRWHIDMAARARWGARRREEARAALVTLGVGAGAAIFLGLPDQGLTALLIEGDALEQALRIGIDAFAPTWVVGPSRADRHPDHSAVAVALERIAWRIGAPAASQWLAAVVHGHATAADVRLVLDGAALQRKRAALAAHRTQLALSRGRLERMAAAIECFSSGAPAAAPGDGVVPYPPHRRWYGGQTLLIVAEDGEGAVTRLRVALPRQPSPDRLPALPQGWRLTLDGTSLRVSPAAGCVLLHVKIERAWPRWVIFDADGWHRA